MAEQPTVTKITQDLDKVSLSDLSPGVVNNLPTPEFIEQVKRIEDRQKAQQAVLPPVVASAPVQNSPSVEVIQPIELTYKFTGQCPIHKVEVETLILDVEKTMVACAWCGVCKKVIKQQKVKSLEESIEKRKEKHEETITDKRKVRKS